jgi:L-asparagine transporter-like permease
MVVTALFSTAGATNATLYPAVGVSRDLARTGQFPTILGRDVGRRRASVGLLVMSGLTIVLVVLFNLDSIASLGSAVALIVFSMVTLGHFRLWRTTGAQLWLLVVGFASTVITLVVFCTTTLVDEPATAVTLVVLLLLAIGIDLAWTRVRDQRIDVGAASG